MGLYQGSVFGGFALDSCGFWLPSRDFWAFECLFEVGRMGGQFAKPRSHSFAEKNGIKLPSYRGDNIEQGDRYAWISSRDFRRGYSREKNGKLLRLLRGEQ